MLMSVAEIARNAGMYPELAGARVLVTGVQATRGVDLVRAFGEHGCRMVLQIPEVSAEIERMVVWRPRYQKDATPYAEINRNRQRTVLEKLDQDIPELALSGAIFKSTGAINKSAIHRYTGVSLPSIRKHFEYIKSLVKEAKENS